MGPLDEQQPYTDNILLQFGHLSYYASEIKTRSPKELYTICSWGRTEMATTNVAEYGRKADGIAEIASNAEMEVS